MKLVTPAETLELVKAFYLNLKKEKERKFRGKRKQTQEDVLIMIRDAFRPIGIGYERTKAGTGGYLVIDFTGWKDIAYGGNMLIACEVVTWFNRDSMLKLRDVKALMKAYFLLDTKDAHKDRIVEFIDSLKGVVKEDKLKIKDECYLFVRFYPEGKTLDGYIIDTEGNSSNIEKLLAPTK